MPPQVDPHLVTLTDQHSPIAEQYRNLRAKLFLAVDSCAHKAVLVTSAVPREGKTLTAVNLAITIAQSVQEKALLVDTDLRRPSVHTLLGLQPEKGLSDYLRDEIGLEEVLLRTPVDKLTVLPAGAPVPNPSELLGSEKMAALIKEVKSRYPDRFVIFDSPPVLHLADSMLLAKAVDLTLFVVMAGRTPRETVARALASYGPSNILGIVLNNVQALPAEYTYGYKHYSKAYYGRRQD